MKPNKNMKLADLMYGHGSKFMCSLSGRFDPEKYSDAPPIQICEMKCGCWVVADGNNRIGLILKKNPEATIGDIPERLIASSHGMKGVAPPATGRTPDEAKRLLEDKLRIMLETESVSLVLTPLTPIEDHQCILLRPTEN